MSVVKRSIDLLFAAAALVFASPLYIIVSIFIRLESSGPILRRQKAIGQNGIEFILYKFRTMVDVNQNNHEGKLSVDYRVTAVGRFLRATSLDELPQLLNVVKGELSLVGPRPINPSMAAALHLRNEKFQARLLVKPGITGWSQIHSRTDTRSADTMLELDLFYISSRSLMLDLIILVRTLGIVTSSKFYVDVEAKQRSAIEKVGYEIVKRYVFQTLFFGAIAVLTSSLGSGASDGLSLVAYGLVVISLIDTLLVLWRVHSGEFGYLQIEIDEIASMSDRVNGVNISSNDDMSWPTQEGSSADDHLFKPEYTLGLNI